MMETEVPEDPVRAARRRALILRILFTVSVFTFLDPFGQPQHTRNTLRGGDRRYSRAPADDKTTEELAQQLAFEQHLKSRIAELNATVHGLPGDWAEFPMNISGTFRGEWEMESRAVDDHVDAKPRVEVVPQKNAVEFHSALELNSNFTPPSLGLGLPFDYEKGRIKLFLQSHPSRVDGVHYVTGKVDLVDGMSRSQRDILTTLNGYYLQKQGRLTLFFNSGYKSKHVAVDFASPTQNQDRRRLEEEQDHHQSIPHFEQNIINKMRNQVVDSLEDSKELDHNDGIELQPYGDDDDGLVESNNNKGRNKEEEEEDKLGANVNITTHLEETNQNGTLEQDIPRLWETELVNPAFLRPSRNTFDPYRTTPPCYFRFDLVARRKQDGKTISGEPESLEDQMQRTPPPGTSLRMVKMMYVAGSTSSMNCEGLSLSLRASALEIDATQAVRKASNYSLMETIITFFQTLLLVVQLNYSSTQTGSAKVSIVAIAMMCLIDAGFAFAYFSSGLIHDRLFSAFVIAAFLKLLLVSVFEMRFLLIIWQARYPQAANEGMSALQRQQGIIQTRIYLCLFASIVTIWWFIDYLKLFWLVAFSYWVPQIVTNVIRESGDPYHLGFFGFMSISRLLTPLYIYGCPSNFLNLLVEGQATYYDPVFCIILVTWVGIQVALLLVQREFGPRVFVPARFLPAKYDYNRKIPDDLRNSDCAICMMPVNGVDEEHWITPCAHLFHKDCLRTWTLQKMECPTCRAQLPPTG